MTGRRPVRADDLVEIRWAMEPAISPGGERVAYVESGLDRLQDSLSYELVCFDVGTGRRWRVGPPGARRRAPHWSPDGSLLAFLADLGGNWRPWVVDVRDAGDASGRPLAALPGTATGFDWAPDGRTAVASVEITLHPQPPDAPYVVDSLPALRRVREGSSRRTIWVLPEGGAAEVLGDPSEEAWAGAWSPRGGEVAFLSDRGVTVPGSEAAGLWLTSADGSRRRCLVPPDGPVRTFAWSPDGSMIAWIGHHRGDAQGENLELWVVPVAEAASARCLSAELDRSIGLVVRGDDERGTGPPSLAWAADGRRILAAWADGGRSGLGAFSLDGSSKVILGGARAVLQFSSAATTGRLAFAWADPVTPGEVSIAESDGSGERRISETNDSWAAAVELAPTRVLQVQTGDGPAVEAFVTDPPRAGEGSGLIVQVHGGPHYPIGSRFSFDAQRLAALGYRVVRLNPRGSQGYGAEFARAVCGDWGGGDLRDLLAVVDAIASDRGGGTARVAIIGESYGGYVALWAIARTRRFAAAVSENGISNLLAASLTADAAAFWSAELGSELWKDPAALLARSPIAHADRIRTPLLLVHAERDRSCPIAQSEEMFVALQRLGREVELVRIPGEDHWVNLFGSPARRLERTRLIDSFLVRHLPASGGGTGSSSVRSGTA